jgi:hypothetical protein
MRVALFYGRAMRKFHLARWIDDRKFEIRGDLTEVPDLAKKDTA